MSSVSCLGRCYLPKHKCMRMKSAKAGPIPKNMGWHYTAKDSPEHQVKNFRIKLMNEYSNPFLIE